MPCHLGNDGRGLIVSVRHPSRRTWNTPADVRTLMQSRISRDRLACSGCTMWQVYTAAETPSAQAEYDDRKRPKPKVWPKNYFYIRPKLNIGRICTTAHIRPPKPKPNFARPLHSTVFNASVYKDVSEYHLCTTFMSLYSTDMVLSLLPLTPPVSSSLSFKNQAPENVTYICPKQHPDCDPVPHLCGAIE